MPRSFRVLLLALALIGTAGVSPSHANALLSETELREAAYAGEVDRVEAAFVAAQEAFERRELSADEMRDLVMVLTVTHPKMAKLTQDWLRQYPQSPHAHIVQAWLYNDIAWNIRGPHIIRKTYPAAIQEFHAWHRKAHEHAQIAFEKAPRLIPASDAIIKFANGSGNRATAFQVLDDVMRTDPNMGTLQRALWLTAPGWGGTAQQAKDMCDSYARGLEAKIDPVDMCLLYAWKNHHWTSMADWAYEVVGKTENPDLASFRMFGILQSWGWGGPEDARFSYDYLTREGVVWRVAAETFDMNIPQKYGLPYIYEAHHRKAIALTRAELELDPYNPDLIDELRVTLVPDFHRNALGQPMTADEVITLTPQEEQELVRRQLVTSPYQSRHWWSMWRFLAEEAAPHEVIDLDPYLINSVVYSNHRMWELHSLLNKKIDQYKLSQDIVLGKVESDGYSVTDDVDNDIICPLIRAQRLYEKVCPATKDEHSSTCEYSRYRQADLEAIWAKAEERKICVRERFAPVSWLKFKPLPVELPNASGG